MRSDRKVKLQEKKVIAIIIMVVVLNPRKFDS